MDSSRKIFGITLYLLLAAGIATLVLRSPRPAGHSAFKGWTNISGQLHATIEFPPVNANPPAKNYFVFGFYCVQLDFNYLLPDGRATNQSVWLPVGNSPRQLTTVHIPIPPRITNLQFTRAQTSIERRWDNIDLPLRRRSTFFTFTPPTPHPLPEP
jgi:hypothetical protein